MTGGTSLGLGKFKPQWLAEIGTRRTELFDGQTWSSLPSMNRAKVSNNDEIEGSFLDNHISFKGSFVEFKLFFIRLNMDVWWLQLKVHAVFLLLVEQLGMTW